MIQSSRRFPWGSSDPTSRRSKAVSLGWLISFTGRPISRGRRVRFVADDRSLSQGEVDGDRGWMLANADRLLRLLMTLPGRRDDALAVVNGFFGDRLADQGSTLAIPMTLRSRTGALAPDRETLAGEFPEATGSIALFVHGLMSTESIWEFPGDPDTTYGNLLARDHGVTPIYVRYNTGQHISVNGRELAGLLHRLVSAWPVPVHDISLIGHSMGGLVIRSSCHYAPPATMAKHP